MKPFQAIVTSAAVLGLGVIAHGAMIISQNAVAPVGSIISQPDFSGSAGGGDYTDNAGPPAQTFTAPVTFTLQSITIKGNANNGGSFGGFSGDNSFTITVSKVAADNTLTLLDQQSLQWAPSDGAAYLTFTLDSNLLLIGGSQYAFSIYTSSGFYGMDESSSDVYGGGTAAQQGNSAGSALNGDTLTNLQSVDRTFFVSGIPEPATSVLLGIAGLALLRRSGRPERCRR